MNVIPLEGLHERLRHPVGLGTVKRSRTDLQAHHTGKPLRFMGHVTRPVVTQPLDRRRNFIHQAETSFNGLRHQVPDQVSGDAPGCANIAHNLPVTAVQAEGHPDPFSVPAGDLEGIQTPAAVAPVHPDSLPREDGQAGPYTSEATARSSS